MQKREVPGPIRHPDQVQTNEQLMNLALDQDDVIWLQQGDETSALDFIDKAVKLLGESRFTCKWYQFSCQAQRRKVQRELTP